MTEARERLNPNSSGPMFAYLRCRMNQIYDENTDNRIHRPGYE